MSLLVAEMMKNQARAEFEYQVRNVQLSIQTRVQSYIDVLRGVSALFYTGDQMTRKQFHAYVAQLDLLQRFPGITNLNFAQRVVAADKAAFESSVRRDTSLDARGYPYFSIKPQGKRPEYHVLTYIEPFQRNLVSFGLDIASREPVALALAAARDTGQLTSSGKLIHITGPYKHTGLAMRIPLYRRDMPLHTMAERRAAYYGSVGAGFNIEAMMLGTIDKKILPHMRLKLYDADGKNESPASDTDVRNNLLFDNEETPENSSKASPPAMPQDLFIQRISMAVGPRVWDAEFSARQSAMLSGFDAWLPWLVLASGLIGSLLLYGSYYSLTSARRRAVELARDMTKDLRNSEASLAEAQRMAHLGSWLLEPASGRMSWSMETYRIFGAERLPQAPQYDDFLASLHDDDRQRVCDGIKKSISNAAECNIEHRIRQRDGSVRWVQTIARCSNDDHGTLLRGIVMDITERKQTVEALQRSQELLRELTAYQDRVKEDERKRIAREIHDELGQTLLALRIDVSMLDTRTGATHPKLNRKVRSALRHIDATIKTIRAIINNLRPSVLDIGLNAAIEWQVQEFRRLSGIACDLVMGEQEFVLDDGRATSLFRILQESLTNVIRHANASHVVIELQQEDQRLVMKITDNGVGIDQNQRKTANAFGLIGVEERILALDGALTIDSAPGQGTTLTVYIPLATSGKQAPPL